MPPFPVSIAFLSLVQAVVILLPRPAPGALPPRLASRWWAIVPPASIAVVVALVAAASASADALTYLALVAVPPLAALALAALVRRASPPLALAVVPLFAVAWGHSGSLAGETAGLVLSALACVTLGWVLAAVVPDRWLPLGVYAMAVVDAALVAADLLQGPNSVLVAAAPAADLPRLQAVYFGPATMGFGDLFVAATVGVLLAARRRHQVEAALLAAILGCAFDLLFLTVDVLPATVPIAIALALVQARHRRGTESSAFFSGPSRRGFRGVGPTAPPGSGRSRRVAGTRSSGGP
jgi:hypothetical protein